MTSVTEPPDIMSKPLTAAAMSAILNPLEWRDDGTKRVQCTHRTEALLRKAGVPDPKPLEHYDVKVRRDEKGFLVINPSAGKAPLIEAGDDSLFEAGGLFAGEQAPVDAGAIQAEISRNRAVRIAPDAVEEMERMCEFTRTRTFEVSIDPHTKVRVQVVAFEDQALPSPNERERWMPQKASNVQIHAAVSALHMARDLGHFENI